MLSDPATALGAGAAQSDVREKLTPLVRGERDHRNGYVWLDLGGLTFGDKPCGLSLCFYESRLAEASWNIRLPGEELEGGWPTRVSSEAEIAFVRDELTRQLGIGLHSGAVTLPWGEVWSLFDEKGYSAANGLRWLPRI